MFDDVTNIYLTKLGRSRAITAENLNGKKGKGGQKVSTLGVGRKGSAFISLKKGEVYTLVNVKGPGIIQHIWITVTDETDMGCYVLRDLVIRMYWDEEVNPSVEVPLGDFFCNGFGTRCEVNSLPIVATASGGMNCYFPMPFKKSARITIANEHSGDIEAFFYQFDYILVDKLPNNTACFHAQWIRENPTVPGRDYTIIDNVKGKGHYVGTYLSWAALERYWWGEGEIKFYIDGDKKWPTICGTGTEDYFGGAWGFRKKLADGSIRVTTYCTPFLGYPFYSKIDETRNNIYAEVSCLMHGLYRWHIMDPVLFDEELRVNIQQIGHDGKNLFERSDDISSVAYWYQIEPHNKFPILLPVEKRRPR